MMKLFPTLMLAVLVASSLTGCDAQRWVSTVKAPVPAAAVKSHVSPTFSMSGRVEAKVLAQYGPLPKDR
jgi:hypothetical protein